MKISATARINNGIMRSNDFFMTGPAAETEIKGEMNLAAETQNLEVKVVPHISDSLSLAALAGGPISRRSGMAGPEGIERSIE